MFGHSAAVLALVLLPQYEDRTWETICGVIAAVVALVLLVFCWIRGECELRTKLILTALYVLLWPLTLLSLLLSHWALMVGQVVFASVVLLITFDSRSR
jgi:hypothetical protein